MVALSEASAVGVVIAHGICQAQCRLVTLAATKPVIYSWLCCLQLKGTVGDSLSSSQHPDVFVSSDGGYSWKGTLRGAHHYSILDSGGLIVAVEAQREGQVKIIKYII